MGLLQKGQLCKQTALRWAMVVEGLRKKGKRERELRDMANSVVTAEVEEGTEEIHGDGKSKINA